MNVSKKVLTSTIVFAVLFVVLSATALNCGKKGIAETKETVVEKSMYVTVKAPGASMHTTSDVKSRKNYIKDGKGNTAAVPPGVQVKVVGEKVIAYEVINQQGKRGWIYAGLVTSMTNK